MHIIDDHIDDVNYVCNEVLNCLDNRDGNETRVQDWSRWCASSRTFITSTTFQQSRDKSGINNKLI